MFPRFLIQLLKIYDKIIFVKDLNYKHFSNLLKVNKYINKKDLHISNNLENSWTLLLKGKNILIISDYYDKLKNAINNIEKIYNIDLFPECNILLMDSPNIYNNTKTIKEIKETYMNKINEIQSNIDIILIDIKYYSYLFIHEFYKLNKSCIQLDEDLKYYFGIYDNYFINNHKDILTKYLNEYWQKV